MVAAAVYAQHREWLSKLRRDGTPHKDTSMRVMRAVEFAGYDDRWDLLDAPADSAPLLLGDWYQECVEMFGFPPGHPGWPQH